MVKLTLFFSPPMMVSHGKHAFLGVFRCHQPRRFNKKGAHRFHLVHRSQRDPLYDEPNVSKYVLLPTEGSAANVWQFIAFEPASIGE